MSSDTKRLLKQLDKKELREIARLKKINIPKDWSQTLIVELLALNVSKKDIRAIVAKTPEAATGISFVFILPQMFFGTFIPITNTTRQIATFIPSYYVLDALNLIFEGDWTNTNILLDMGVVSIVSIAIVIIGILLFEKYGNA